jgi:hypothetical protein
MKNLKHSSYDLLYYVGGTFRCPSSTADEFHISFYHPSLSATAKTSHEAWKKLKTLYATWVITSAMQLKEELTLIQHGNRSITDYLHAVKA